ncbi:uncharacterized protein BJ171DRAFT_564619 [Polychytrium aggregatum]|uniref:uncharacterized protein n=1 Tax=Polychytrium aggregatum TaxID=110093 RepID=UPI0022FE3F2F|nr:uncharacterized protein BJ171DRAFT_564619 [Polychytrium aggregatum]KAI9209441.1 hypothetical protein BJ171DRAFT_564619 [Polychytrium aggregatum]
MIFRRIQPKPPQRAPFASTHSGPLSPEASSHPTLDAPPPSPSSSVESRAWVPAPHCTQQHPTVPACHPIPGLTALLSPFPGSVFSPQSQCALEICISEPAYPTGIVDNYSTHYPGTTPFLTDSSLGAQGDSANYADSTLTLLYTPGYPNCPGSIGPDSQEPMEVVSSQDPLSMSDTSANPCLEAVRSHSGLDNVFLFESSSIEASRELGYVPLDGSFPQEANMTALTSCLTPHPTEMLFGSAGSEAQLLSPTDEHQQDVIEAATGSAEAKPGVALASVPVKKGRARKPRPAQQPKDTVEPVMQIVAAHPDGPVERKKPGRKRPKNMNPIPRPCNCWIIYLGYWMPRVKQYMIQNPPKGFDPSRLSGRDILHAVTREVSRMWRTEPCDVQKDWRAAAKQVLKNHKELHKEYKYSPRRNPKRRKVNKQARSASASD